MSLYISFWSEFLGEAIEEPVMNVEGEGSGADNESCIVSEVIEEDVMYFFGNGSGSDCLTGNQSEKEEETKGNSKSDSNSVEKTEVDNNPAKDTKPAENCKTENHVEKLDGEQKPLEKDSDEKKPVDETKCVKKTAYVCGKKDDDEKPSVVEVEAATSENIEANGDVKCAEKESDSQVVVTEVTEDEVLPAATNGTEDDAKDQDSLSVNAAEGKFFFVSLRIVLKHYKNSFNFFFHSF